MRDLKVYVDRKCGLWVFLSFYDDNNVYQCFVKSINKAYPVGYEIGYEMDSHNRVIFLTESEAIEAAKDQLLAAHDPFEHAINKINIGIERNVADARNKLHLKMAEFRGFLFSQSQTLRL